MARHSYTVKEIEDMRTLIKVMYVFKLQELKGAKLYEMYMLAEAMLGTYIAAGITYDDLHKKFKKHLVTQ